MFHWPRTKLRAGKADLSTGPLRTAQAAIPNIQHPGRRRRRRAF